MNKVKVFSIILGVLILITTIIMVVQVGNVAYEHSMHDEWSLGVKGAVQITLSIYSVIICVFSTLLVALNFVNNKNDKKKKMIKQE